MNIRGRYIILALACLGVIAAAPTYTSLILSGSSSGTLQLKAPAAAGTGSVLTFPGHTTDFSGTGGTSQVVKQTSSGGAFTVARLACADLSDSSTGCTGTSSSGGDVVGPGSSTAGHFAIFDGTTGKLLKDTLAAPATSATIDATSKQCPVGWDSTTTVVAATVPCMVARYSGTINSVSYYTGGTGTPSFTAGVTINGTNVTSCVSLTVNSSSLTTTSCTAANTFSSGDLINVVVSSPSGTPNQAIVQINFHQTGS